MLSAGRGCGARVDPAQPFGESPLNPCGVCLVMRGRRPQVAHAPLCLLAPTSAVDQSNGTVSRLSRARISFPVLKRGTAFSATETTAQYGDCALDVLLGA